MPALVLAVDEDPVALVTGASADAEAEGVSLPPGTKLVSEPLLVLIVVPDPSLSESVLPPGGPWLFSEVEEGVVSSVVVSVLIPF